MESSVLNKKGFTFFEVTAVIAIVFIVLSMVIANYKTRIDKANLDRTISEMSSIASASLDYYNSQGSWPSTPNNLSPTYMHVAVTSSPFGGSYQITSLSNGTVTISTTVPSGLANNYYQGTLLGITPGARQDTVAITQQIPNQFSGRLEYEKQYRYLQ